MAVLGDRELEKFLHNTSPRRLDAEEQASSSQVGRSLSVLVVDDEPNVREGLAKVLRYKGYRIEVASNAHNAMEMMRQENFDAVITDLRMPGQDGLELLREAKESWPDIQFIMMTAYGEVKSYLEARKQGAVEYFNKPVRIDDLLAVLSNIRLKRTNRSEY